ncbi:MAG: pentapeptide repeat-containing protein [Spirochaetales bacterium]|nr:pentapeptide repeat-containing protein [Spirochaetales bacterium]
MFLKKWVLKVAYFSKRLIIFPLFRVIKGIFTNPFYTGLVILFLALGVFVFYNALVFTSHPSSEFLMLLARVHGFFGDVLIFSLISTGLMMIFNHHRKTQDLREKLDDFSAWDSEEAFFRKAGIIKALSRRYSPVFQVKAMVLRNSAIEKANFRGALIEDSYFQKCLLDGADFQKANINPHKPCFQIFKESSLSYCLFNEAHIRWVDFSGLNLEGAVFNKALFEQVDFKNCNLQHASFREVTLFAPDFTNCNFYRADFSYTVMPEVIFSLSKKHRFKNSRSARLHHCDFQFAQMDKGCFCKCDVSFSLFYSASLKDVDFSYADLSHCDFRSTCLMNADFKGADMNQAHLEGADLTGANLKQAENLEIWQLEKVKSLYQASLDDEMILKLKEMDLNHLFEFPKKV